MANKGITGGAPLDFIFGGLHLAPKAESALEIKLGGRENEWQRAGNGDTYAKGKATVGRVKCDFIVTDDDFSTLCEMRDTGHTYSGSFTTAGGKVYVINGGIEGEILNNDGECSLTISGNITLM